MTTNSSESAPDMLGMVEKAARAIEPRAWRVSGPEDTLAQRNRRVSSLRKAKEVLKALREPTPEMVEAGQAVDCTITAGPVWQAMIDAALAGKE